MQQARDWSRQSVYVEGHSFYFRADPVRDTRQLPVSIGRTHSKRQAGLQIRQRRRLSQLMASKFPRLLTNHSDSYDGYYRLWRSARLALVVEAGQELDDTVFGDDNSTAKSASIYRNVGARISIGENRLLVD